MNRNLNYLFDFDDLLIEPAILSNIRSRSEITSRYEHGNLPLMTAPMDTVISPDNVQHFIDNGIIPVLPRGTEYTNPNPDQFLFKSYGLDEFEKIFLNEMVSTEHKIYALIDIANGHMSHLYDVAKKAKRRYGTDMVLMVGNVANPFTYEEYSKIEVDYVRIGIGNGNGCLTTVQTGVGFPMASLIDQCKQIKRKNNFKTKIVADGGFKKYSDVVKALGLGADYVMLGSMFNKALESAGETIYYEQETPMTIKQRVIIDQYGEEAKERFSVGSPLFKTFRGMSTKEVQKAWGITELKTSEGIVKTQQVEYTLSGWTHNFESYLKSAMSYSGKQELPHFIGGVQINIISQNSFLRFSK